MGSLRSKVVTQKAFTMTFRDLAVYTNDENTRSTYYHSNIDVALLINVYQYIVHPSYDVIIM